ncbi:MAG TPA: hypothetical protein VHX38_15405 [Pseudonocardiaceae bacterium]|jgi:hypothetical protein|nr:hypothetical protein [Pseudonocardiaceae bacterium]
MIEPLSPDGLTVQETANLAEVQQRDAVNAAGSAAKLAAKSGTAADQAAVMDGSAATLVSAAGTGFKIEPAAATALAISCGDSIRTLEAVQVHLRTVTQAPKLGALPGVPEIASFTGNVGSDHQGIEKAVNSLMSTLTQMQTAYENAAKSYQNVDQEVNDAVSKFKLPSDPQA